MPTALDHELKRLLVGTDEQRRRVGQALWHFYRSMVFWMRRGQGLHPIARRWAAGGTGIFAALASTLQELGDARVDRPLRRFVAEVLGRLADDLEHGDHMLVPFLRWLEGMFPDLTEMIRQEQAESRIYDLELARALEVLFAGIAARERAPAIAEIRASAAWLRQTDEARRPAAPGEAS